MADLNALIAQGFQSKAMPDPFEQYARVQQLEQGRQANQLNLMKMDEYQRGLAEQNQLRQLDPAAADYLAQVARINPKTGFAFGKLQQEASKAKLLGQKTEVEVADARRKFLSQGLRDIADNPSDENVIAWTQDAVRKGFMDPEQATASLDHMMRMTPEQRVTHMLRQGASPGELKPTTNVIDQSGVKSLVQTPAFGGTPTTIGTYADVPLPADVVAQKAQIAFAGRAPAQPRPEQPPVAVVDPVTGKQVYVSRDEAIGNRMTPAAGLEGLPAKEIQKREAKYPAATAAVKETIATQDQLIKDLEDLKGHKGLDGMTGLVGGRTPNITSEAREAKAKFDKIMARGGFSELAAMRAASPTGGALGNISDTEGKYLRQAFAALDPTQDTKSFQKAIDDAIMELKGSRGRVQDAYDTTYDYRAGTPQAAQSTSAPTSGWGKAVAK